MNKDKDKDTGTDKEKDKPVALDTAFFVAWITKVAHVIEAERAHLSELDAAIGDGDHGTNLDRGFASVLRVLDTTAPRSPATVLALTGTTLISKVGGASGPLYGTAFRRAGNALDDAAQVDLPGLAAALDAALAAVRKLGAARDGDKTMIDALAPAVAALNQAAAEDKPLIAALDATVAAAEAGAQATLAMQASKGRASYLGPRSVGHEDPGAASTVLILTALRDTAVAAAGGSDSQSSSESNSQRGGSGENNSSRSGENNGSSRSDESGEGNGSSRSDESGEDPE